MPTSRARRWTGSGTTVTCRGRNAKALLIRLVERFPADRLVDALRARLGDLAGADIEAILRLLEAFGDESLYDDLAAALVAQPDLPAERAWEALALLDASGRIERYPDLLERWDDLNEEIDEGSLDDLARQLEEEPDGSWLALQGLGAVEPEVRAEIIAGLADQGGGAGLIEFLRLLSFAHDPATRSAAFDALEERAVGRARGRRRLAVDRAGAPGCRAWSSSGRRGGWKGLVGIPCRCCVTRRGSCGAS